MAKHRITCDYYDPSSIFLENSLSSDMVGANNFALADRFHTTMRESLHFCRNAGAVQLFSRNGIDQMTTSYGAVSQPIKDKTSEHRSSLGHTERILMRDILDSFITENGHDVEFLSPSQRSRSADRRDAFDIMSKLVDEARDYKNYLSGRRVVVKMWSELKACDYEPASGMGAGGRCLDFINNIFPINSRFGYINQIPEYTNMGDIVGIKTNSWWCLEASHLKYVQNLVDKLFVEEENYYVTQEIEMNLLIENMKIIGIDEDWGSV